MSASLTGTDVALRELGVLARKAQKLDDASLLRFRPRHTGDEAEGASPALSRVWVTTPFGPLGCRSMALTPERDSMVLRVGSVIDATAGFKNVTGVAGGAPASVHTVTAGLPADSSWPGALPPETGFRQVDVIPATVFRDIESQAQSVVREDSGPLGLPGSLLDQSVLTVSEEDGSQVEISMRQVFALCLLGFIPEKPRDAGPVRISTRGRWTRIDGRFGGIYSSSGMGVLPL